MRTVYLGSTGVKVSEVGLGGSQFFYNDRRDRQAVIDVIQYAYELGINYFDTSPSFCSESTFGLALQNFDRSSYFLTSKIGRYASSDVTKRVDLSARRTEESIEASLKKLRTDHLDLVQIEDFDWAERSVSTVVTETLPFLDKLREKGTIKHIGLASYDLSVMREIVDMSPVKIDTVLPYSRLTLIDQAVLDYLPFFKDKGLGVINAAALSLGLLTSNRIPSWVDISKELHSACRNAVTKCSLSRYVIERLANAYSYSEGVKAGIDVFLTGAGSREILDLNIKAYFVGLSKAEKTMADYIAKDVFGALPLEHRDINRIAKEAHLERVKVARLSTSS